MLINLVGPPAVGKSTFASRFVLEHPEFTFCSIDAYRVTYQDEAKAWQELHKDVVNNKDVILETCGLSWRLKELFKSRTVRKRYCLTVALTGDKDDIKDRLTERQKRPINYRYSLDDEQQAIDHVLEHLDWDSAHLRVDTSAVAMNEQYYMILNAINTARMKEHKKEK